MHFYERTTHNLEIRNVRQQQNSCENVEIFMGFFSPCRFHLHLHFRFFFFDIRNTRIYSVNPPAWCKTGFHQKWTKELIKVTLVALAALSTVYSFNVITFRNRLRAEYCMGFGGYESTLYCMGNGKWPSDSYIYLESTELLCKHDKNFDSPSQKFATVAQNTWDLKNCKHFCSSRKLFE